MTEPAPKAESKERAPSGKKRHPIRRFIKWTIFLLLLLVVILLLLLPWIVPQSWLKNAVKDAVRAELGRECDMERAQVSIWRGLELWDFRIHDLPRFSDNELFRVSHVRARLNWTWLLHGEAAFRVNAKDFRLNLVADRNDVWNVQDILERMKKKEPTSGSYLMVSEGVVSIHRPKHDLRLDMKLVRAEVVPIFFMGVPIYEARFALAGSRTPGTSPEITGWCRIEINPVQQERSLFRLGLEVNGFDLKGLELPEQLPVREVSGKVHMTAGLDVEGSRFRAKADVRVIRGSLKVPEFSGGLLEVPLCRLSLDADGTRDLSELTVKHCDFALRGLDLSRLKMGEEGLGRLNSGTMDFFENITLEGKHFTASGTARVAGAAFSVPQFCDRPISIDNVNFSYDLAGPFRFGERASMRDVAVKGLRLDVIGADLAGLRLPFKFPIAVASAKMDFSERATFEASRLRARGRLTLHDGAVIVPELADRPLGIPSVDVSYDLDGDNSTGRITVNRLDILPPVCPVGEEARLPFAVTIRGAASNLELEKWLRNPKMEIHPRLDLDFDTRVNLAALVDASREGEFFRVLAERLDRESRGEGEILPRLEPDESRRRTVRALLATLQQCLPLKFTTGAMQGNIHVNLSETELRADGAFKFENGQFLPANAEPVTLPGLDVSFSAAAALNETHLTLNKAEVRSPLVAVRATGDFSGTHEVPEVVFDLTSEYDLGRLAPDRPEGKVLAYFVKGLADRFAKDPASVTGVEPAENVKRFLHALPEGLDEVRTSLRTDGKMRTGLHVAGPVNELRYTGYFDATDLEVGYGKEFVKKSGMPARTDFSVLWTRDAVRAALPVITLGGLHAVCDTTYTRDADRLDASFGIANFGGISPSDFVKGASPMKLEGGVQLDVRMDRVTRDAALNAKLSLGNLALVAPEGENAPRIALHGQVHITPESLSVRHPLVVLIGDSVGLLEFSVERPLKLQPLADYLGGRRPSPPDPLELVDEPTVAFRFTSPGLDVRPLEAATAGQAAPPADLRALHDVIRRTKVDGHIDVRSLTSTADNVTSVDGHVTMARGEAILRVEKFGFGYLGGRMDFDGSAFDLLQTPVEFYLRRRIDNVQPTERLRTSVSSQFPGLTFTGRMSMISYTRGRLHVDPVNLAASTSGCTTLTMQEGMLRGKSLPDYVGKVFPGLNYSRYGFKTMQNLSYVSSGITYNDMFFVGVPLDIFVLGHTDPDGSIAYTMGVDMTGGPTKVLERPVRYRVPLMTYSGQIVGQEFVDQDLFFVPPQEIAAYLFGGGFRRFLYRGPIDWSFLDKLNVPGGRQFKDGWNYLWEHGPGRLVVPSVE